MLKNIPPILGPELLYTLRAMGHGDEIAIVDANFPGDSSGPTLIRLDGLTATEVLEAVLTVMPLDTFVDEQAIGMEVVGDPKKREAMLHQVQKILHERTRFAPIWDYFWPSGIGPRVEEASLMKIDPFPWSAPLEDVKLKR